MEWTEEKIRAATKGMSPTEAQLFRMSLKIQALESWQKEVKPLLGKIEKIKDLKAKYQNVKTKYKNLKARVIKLEDAPKLTIWDLFSKKK